MVILINPKKSFDSKDMKSLIKYVNSGGKMLILDSILNWHNSTSNEILENFGMEIICSKDEDTTHVRITDSHEKLNEVFKIPILQINGGEKILTDDRVSFCVKKIGNGIVGIAIDSYMFSRAVMDDMYLPPTQSAIDSYQLEFYILKFLKDYKG